MPHVRGLTNLPYPFTIQQSTDDMLASRNSLLEVKNKDGVTVWSVDTAGLASDYQSMGSGLVPSMVPVYGNPTQGDFLGNIEIGKLAGRKVSIRFRAKYSGNVTGTYLYIKYGGAYSGGTNGKCHIELQGNDPNGDLPNGTVLASMTDNTPTAGGDGANRFKAFLFDAPYSVTAGTLYHLVFTNTDADPVTNFFSLDDTINSTSTGPRQRSQSDQDLALLVWDSALAGRFWTMNGRHTPIYEVIYQDGKRTGYGYVNIASGSGLVNIGNANEVRQSMTPTAPKTFNRIWLWLYKLDATTTHDIEIYIRDASFNVLYVTKIPSDDVSTAVSWATAPFHSNITLQAGTTYYLHLRCYYGGSTAYKIFPAQDGISQGFASETIFTDGKAQVSADRGVSWQDSQSGTDRDWIFYFARD